MQTLIWTYKRRVYVLGALLRFSPVLRQGIVEKMFFQYSSLRLVNWWMCLNFFQWAELKMRQTEHYNRFQSAFSESRHSHMVLGNDYNLYFFANVVFIIFVFVWVSSFYLKIYDDNIHLICWKSYLQNVEKAQSGDVRTLIVGGLCSDITDDTIKLFFESNELSGGGRIEKFDRSSEDVASITFKSAEGLYRVFHQNISSMLQSLGIKG